MTIQGLNDLRDELITIRDELPDNVNDAVDRSLSATERQAKRELIAEDAVATTQTYRGFVQTETEMGDRTRHSLSNVVPHSQLTEYGTGQQFGTSGCTVPPGVQHFRAPSFGNELVAGIAQWINTKPSFRRTGRPPFDMAIPIALSIAGRDPSRPSGTPPQPFMRPAWQRGKRVLNHQVRLAVTQTLSI